MSRRLPADLVWLGDGTASLGDHIQNRQFCGCEAGCGHEQDCEGIADRGVCAWLSAAASRAKLGLWFRQYPEFMSSATWTSGRTPAGTALWGVNSVSWGFNSAARSSGPVCGLRLQCGNCRAAAGGCHRASLMIKPREAAAAVRPGPAAPIRLTAPVVSAVHAPGLARPGRRCRIFPPADCGPGGPFRVSLDW
jgi:hypothetical protein